MDFLVGAVMSAIDGRKKEKNGLFLVFGLEVEGRVGEESQYVWCHSA